MMNTYIEQFREWFNAREKREKFLIFIGSWALIYAVFTLTLFNTIDEKNALLAKEISKTDTDIQKTQEQLKFISEIPNTPIYKDWQKQNEKFQALKKQYSALLTKSSKDHWTSIIRTLLQSHPNISMVSIEQLPETARTAKTDNTAATGDIFEQHMKLVVTGNYGDMVAYLQSLEKALVNIHWDSLDYKVTEYPKADVTMEFSILYEKNT